MQILILVTAYWVTAREKRQHSPAVMALMDLEKTGLRGAGILLSSFPPCGELIKEFLLVSRSTKWCRLCAPALLSGSAPDYESSNVVRMLQELTVDTSLSVITGVPDPVCLVSDR
jgi:hypothetical protein